MQVQAYGSCIKSKMPEVSFLSIFECEIGRHCLLLICDLGLQADGFSFLGACIAGGERCLLQRVLGAEQVFLLIGTNLVPIDPIPFGCFCGNVKTMQ